MLGTPNAGTRTAVAAIIGAPIANLFFPVRYPAIYELTPPYVLGFNLINKERRGTRFYTIAGNYTLRG
jgi:hypothetical protein